LKLQKLILDGLLFIFFGILKRILKVFSQLVIAISLFHELKLIHQHIKPARIFLNKDLDVVLGIIYDVELIYVDLFVQGILGKQIALRENNHWIICYFQHQRFSKMKRFIFILFICLL
jgi:serine/threonine protein kinase